MESFCRRSSIPQSANVEINNIKSFSENLLSRRMFSRNIIDSTQQQSSSFTIRSFLAFREVWKTWNGKISSSVFLFSILWSVIVSFFVPGLFSLKGMCRKCIIFTHPARGRRWAFVVWIWIRSLIYTSNIIISRCRVIVRIRRDHTSHIVRFSLWVNRKENTLFTWRLIL